MLYKRVIRNMHQKTRKGNKNVDRWLGPYTIIKLSKTTCKLQNIFGRNLKTSVHLSQLKPYHTTDNKQAAVLVQNSIQVKKRKAESPLNTPHPLKKIHSEKQLQSKLGILASVALLQSHADEKAVLDLTATDDDDNLMRTEEINDDTITHEKVR